MDKKMNKAYKKAAEIGAVLVPIVAVTMYGVRGHFEFGAEYVIPAIPMFIAWLRKEYELFMREYRAAMKKERQEEENRRNDPIHVANEFRDEVKRIRLCEPVKLQTVNVKGLGVYRAKRGDAIWNDGGRR